MISCIKLLLGIWFSSCHLVWATDRLPEDLNPQTATHQTLSFIEHCQNYEICDLISHARINLFSLPGNDGFERGHELLDTFHRKYGPINKYSAILVHVRESETDWIRAQIGTFNDEEEANNAVQLLKNFYPKYHIFYTLPANVVSKNEGMLEAAELHFWES